LHLGEVLVQEGERIEVISRHVNRAHRLMEVAAPGQILASEVVVDAAAPPDSRAHPTSTPTADKALKVVILAPSETPRDVSLVQLIQNSGSRGT